MNFLFGILPVAALLAFGYGVFRIFRYSRDRDMRSLAVKCGLQYNGRVLPESFRMVCYPADCIQTAWNVIEGEQRGITFLIFDSTVGETKGAYCTFFAAQTPKSLVADVARGEKIIEASGWAAVYRLKFNQLPPWTLSVQRIEDLLNQVLSATSEIQK